MIKKHQKRYIYMLPTTERFGAATKENLRTYQRKLKYGRKPVC